MMSILRAISATPSAPRGDHLGWGIGIAAFALYLATFTRVPTGDSLITVLAIEGDARGLFVPHRLLIQPLCWVFVQGWMVLGWSGGSLFPLQVFSAVGGAVAVTLVFAIGHRLTGSRGAALLAAVGFAVCTAAWAFSTDVEPVMQPLALGLLPWYVLVAAPTAPSRRRVILLGLLVGGAILTYHLSAFLVPVLVAGLLLGDRPTSRAAWARVALFLGTVIVVVVPIYAVALVAIFGVGDWQAIQGWRLYGGLGDSGTPYGHLSWTNVPYAAYGLLRSLIWYPPVRMDESTAAYVATASWAERTAFAAYVGVGLGVVAAPLIWLVAWWRRVTIARQDAAVLAVWAILHTAFAIWWVPGDLQFWVPVLVAWWLLVGVIVATPGRRLFGVRPWPVAIAGVIVLLLVNGLGFSLPGLSTEHDRRHILMAGVREVAAPEDLIITSGLDSLRLYLPYFTRRPVIDIYGELISTRGQDPGEVLARIDRQVTAVQTAGRRVFIVDAGSAGEPGPATDVAGQVVWTTIRRQRMWPTWQSDQTAQAATAYLDTLPARRVWERESETILEVMSLNTAPTRDADATGGR